MIWLYIERTLLGALLIVLLIATVLCCLGLFWLLRWMREE
jgi:cell division protein FtsL